MVFRRINMFLPTYKRVKSGRLLKHLESAIRLVSNPDNICYTFLSNEDDVESMVFLTNLQQNKFLVLDGRKIDFNLDSQVLFTKITDAPHLAKYYNQIYEETSFNSEDVIVSMIGDDMIWKTQDYDLKILNKINEIDGFGLVWCNDSYFGKDKCPVNLFTTRSYVRSTKKPFMCESFSGDMIDLVWGKVAKLSNTAYYLPDVILYHDHNTRIKDRSQWDETRQRLVPQIQLSRKNIPMIDEYVKEAASNIINAKSSIDW